MSSAFDRALETRDLMAAAREFALRHGDPGVPRWRLAFRRRALEVILHMLHPPARGQ
jgi:hypothetical protein